MTNPGSVTPRAWQRMLSGRRLDLLDPSPLDIEIEDIAHGLARVARWNGQTIGAHAFSVAEHSMLVEELVRRFAPDSAPRWLLAALLHDAPEYVVGDMISPFKAVLGDGYRTFETRIQEAVYLRFGLPAQLPSQVSKLIKRADRAAAFLEATQLAGFGAGEAAKFFGRPGRLGGDKLDSLFRLTPLPTAEAQQKFLARFASLKAETGRDTGIRPY